MRRDTDVTRRRILRSAAAGTAVTLVGAGLWRSQSTAVPAVAPTATALPVVPGLGLDKFADPLRIPPVRRPRGNGAELTVRLRRANVRVHGQLPEVPMWTFDGHHPGPTIEVFRDQLIRVRWQNELSGAIPVVAVEVPAGDGDPPKNHPGRDGADPVKHLAAVPPWAAVHLHGAHTGGGNDGWAENAVMPGAAQLSEYPNAQPAATLWYHDHAMHLTRYTIMAGLAGFYLVRDREEEALGLPSGDYDIPLMLCDRNLDTDDDGRLAGRLLNKVVLRRAEPKVTGEFTGPYTMVNGVIWPYLNVKPRSYRFRIANVSNYRTFRLMLLDENGEPVMDAVRLIGVDQGLLGAPAPLPDPLPLAPAERADLLIDFSRLRGRKPRLVNVSLGADPGKADPAGGVPEPDVMQFRVSGGSAVAAAMPKRLSPSFHRVTTADVPADVPRRWVVIPPPGAYPGQPVNVLWEMEEVKPAQVTVPGPGIIQIAQGDGQVRTLRRTAQSYEDRTGVVAARGQWERWHFLALTREVHPMHIHATGFQVLSRVRVDRSGYNDGTGGTTTPLRQVGEDPLPAWEQGWKDIITVTGGQLVTVAARFDHPGRFVYHCHLLEHEMHMMRPFVVLPPEVMMLQH
ncbi:multicopper oxidase domain-containing protein [Nonomuraea angiospora]|uniref:multicopper oxidase family protein n=1 Tax=Nonomuraea angiospora TaxID=46172 RepID=UPI00343FA1CE